MMIKRRVQGFSLVEILVSLTVFGLVMAAAGVAFISIYKNWQRQRDYLQCIENARWAMEFMTNEIRKGGGTIGKDASFGGVQENLFFEKFFNEVTYA